MWERNAEAHGSHMVAKARYQVNLSFMSIPRKSAMSEGENKVRKDNDGAAARRNTIRNARRTKRDRTAGVHAT